MSLETIRFWVAIALLVDGAVGLLSENRLQGLAPRISIRRIALVEIAAALALLILHFALQMP